MAQATLTISSKNYSSWSLRGWLLCRMAGLDFEEGPVDLDDPGQRQELLLLSPSVLVPRLSHGEVEVWDTLAIAEYLNEIAPEAGLWPASQAARAHARAGSSGHYRAIRLWEAAVREAGSLDQGAVIRALDHARIPRGPGGPAEMVPGQRHVRMNMYIAQARRGRFEIVRNLGTIDPNERAESDELHLARAI